MIAQDQGQRQGRERPRSRSQGRRGQAGHHQEGARAPGQRRYKKAARANRTAASCNGIAPQRRGQSRGCELPVMATMPISTSTAQTNSAFQAWRCWRSARRPGHWRPPASGSRQACGERARNCEQSQVRGWLRRASAGRRASAACGMAARRQQLVLWHACGSRAGPDDRMSVRPCSAFPRKSRVRTLQVNNVLMGSSR